MPASGDLVLTVNAGSSSLRLAAYDSEGGLARHAAQRYDTRPDGGVQTLRDFLQSHAIPAVTRVAHRIVHGGSTLVAPCRIDAHTEAEIERLQSLAPLHNPVALAWVRYCRELLGEDVTQVAVFDTAFYADLPDVARTYALPREFGQRYGIRRYGFHGIAHQAMWQRWRALQPDLSGGARVVSLQLGGGCSITAVRDGRPLDTSMGFSPLEGLVMATRSGDVDPGVVTYLMRELDVPAGRLEALLNEQSGLLGVSGTSADMRTLLASPEPAARLAIDLYCYRARKYIGAYLAVLGGVDAILFGGGVGENAPAVRARILAGLEWAGIRLDAACNADSVDREACISAAGSGVAVWVIPVDESRALAEAALSVQQTIGGTA